jgi:outer membrane protein OmpA-like peptidoglycan-associated protein
MIKSAAPLRPFLLILGLAVGVAGCSTIADLDPTGLLSDDSSSSTPPASQFPDQAPPTASSDQDAGTTPDLASLPARPVPAATPSQQQQTAQSLASDGAQARYSAQALRGGTEPAAAPPAAADAAPSAEQRILGAADQPPTAEEPAPTAEPAPQTAAAAPTAGPTPAAAPASAEPPTAGPAPQMAAAPPPQGEPAVPPNTNVQTASVSNAASATPVGPSASPPGAEPAVPANAPVQAGATMAIPAASDAALGFKPSSAPPLAPAVNQFVSAPIVQHYQQTAMLAGGGMAGNAAVPAVPPKGAVASAESGSVTANLGALSGDASRIAAMNGGVVPTAIVYFPGDSVSLDKAARAKIRAAVTAFKANGGQGVVRVVGHSSSRTANMSLEKHLEVIFQKSQERADAVARELIHEGVPAAKVLIDAVGDSQPIYYESMPKGEAGNRRAEIFVQS